MTERGPVPVGDEGIDLHAVLDGRHCPATHGYLTDIDGRSVTLWISRRSVDDDGIFIPELGNTMVRFHVFGAALIPLQAVGAVRSAAPASLGPLYLYAPDADTAGVPSVTAPGDPVPRIIDDRSMK